VRRCLTAAGEHEQDEEDHEVSVDSRVRVAARYLGLRDDRRKERARKSPSPALPEAPPSPSTNSAVARVHSGNTP
jgi:hypothetical protein